VRQILKQAVPACLQNFIDGQLAIVPEPVNLTYRDFPSKGPLRLILTLEQYGLCGYTGVAVDDRISKLQSLGGYVNYSNHIEHLKCQQACCADVAANGQEYGRVLAEDLDYRNMIAALEVRGAEVEHFGAVAKTSQSLPILPTNESCAECFAFREGDGGVDGRNADATTSIEVLALNHETLKIWRLAALGAWLDPHIVQTRDDFLAVLRAVTVPADGQLPEFAFVIESIAREYLG
jgi:hypothetical protein